MIKTYEFVVLFSPELTESELQTTQESLISLVKKHKGKVGSVETWGKRPLAYAINKFTEANYLFFVLELDTSAVEPFTKDVKLNTSAIRSLLVIQEPHYKKGTATEEHVQSEKSE